MTWGVIGALKEEVAQILEQMQVDETREAYGLTYHRGTVDGTEVVVVCCGIGTINAAVCTSTLIRELGAQAVVNVGIAGGTSDGLNLLDVVVADEVVFHDSDEAIFNKYYPFRIRFETSKDLRELAVRSIENLNERDFAYRVGRIASGDAFVTSTEQKTDIASRFEPQCVEMEGAAIGQVAHMNDVPFLVIRSISDNADEEAPMTYDELAQRAADHSAKIFLGMLRLAEGEGK